MRLSPIFFLALFSSSVLWAQSLPVWTPTATPTPAATPRSGAEADSATPKNKVAGNAADQKDAQPAVSPVANIAPAHSDLLSTLANRQDQPLMLTLDEAAGVEMTREWRERAKEFESQNMTDGAVQFRWPA